MSANQPKPAYAVVNSIKKNPAGSDQPKRLRMRHTH